MILSATSMMVLTTMLTNFPPRSRKPSIILSNSVSVSTSTLERALMIMDIIHKFTLNEAQQHVFRIIAYHTLGRSKVGPQLRLGVFGEGGMGKSRLIAAVRAWFAALNRQNELVVTAPTGTAAFNVVGITLHSTVNLPIGKHKKKKMGSKTKHWK